MNTVYFAYFVGFLLFGSAVYTKVSQGFDVSDGSFLPAARVTGATGATGATGRCSAKVSLSPQSAVSKVDETGRSASLCGYTTAVKLFLVTFVSCI